jgi:hypothetical protein
MQTAVDTYLAAPDAAMAPALAAVDRVVELNVRQAREVQESTAAWDRWARLFGLTAAAALLAGLAAVLLWVRNLALRPVIHVAEAMRRNEPEASWLRARPRRDGGAGGGGADVQRDGHGAGAPARGPVGLPGRDRPRQPAVRPPAQRRRGSAPTGRRRLSPRSAPFQRLDRQVEKIRRMISDVLDAGVETGQLSLELRA